MKAGDENAIPLCFTCHRALHDFGDEMEFFNIKTEDRTLGKEKAMQLWFSSPAYKGEQE